SIYLARALGRPGLLQGDQRRLWEARYAEVQEILRNFRGDDFRGGWNLVPKQQDRHNTLVYPSTLALLALLEAQRAGLPWDGSAQRRDELLRQTAAWLMDNFQETPSDGWRGHLDDRTEAVYDGLTLKVYAVLLR